MTPARLATAGAGIAYVPLDVGDQRDQSWGAGDCCRVTSEFHARFTRCIPEKDPPLKVQVVINSLTDHFR